MWSPAGAERGFTLLELLVVLLVLGLALLVAAPRFARREGGVEAAARAIAHELERARGRAIDGARIEPVTPGELAARLAAGLRLVQEGAAPLRFFPDGSSSGALLRIEGEGGAAALGVEPATGRIARVDG